MDYRELIVYRSFIHTELFEKMADLIERVSHTAGTGRPGAKADFRGEAYECIALLLKEAGENGFYGNLWHVYLAGLLVNDENAYSLACEIRGKVDGSINEAALHDIGILKGYFDFDFTEMIEGFHIPEFRLVLDYKQTALGRVKAEKAKRDIAISAISGKKATESAGKEKNPEENESKNANDCESQMDESPFGSSLLNSEIRDQICALAKEFEAAGSAQEMKDDLTGFYGHYGVGMFGLHKAFRVEHDDVGYYAGETRIIPVRNIAHVSMSDLIGYERAKKKLIDNTEAFVAGRPANNVLLYGEAGTGKSTSIKAIANEYYDRGLRIIEVTRYQFRDLNNVIAQIKNRNYKFILYMDDLSFEENETEYKYLKAVIEGGLEKRPFNVLIYATSNRRHLIRESFHDRDDQEVGYGDKHSSDTVQEKLSLAYRFGVSIYFGSPSFQEYHEIVSELADRNGITMEKGELKKLATQWEMSHGGLSGRTAQQFIDFLRGTASEE